MLIYRLAIKSFYYYLGRNLLLALGVALTTMVLTGSLIVGDSIRHSLLRTVHYRLGDTEMTINAGERFFNSSLSQRISKENSLKTSSILKLDGIALKDGGAIRLPNIQVLGIDSMFYHVTGASSNLYSDQPDEVTISQNIATILNLKIGDKFILQIAKSGIISFETPFVSDNERYVSIQATVKNIADKNEMGRFNLQNSQTAPYNVLIDIKQLNKLTGFSNKANYIIISNSDNLDIDFVQNILKDVWTYEDAGYKIEHIKNTNEWNISSERIFIDTAISRDFKIKYPLTQPIFTYFVNFIAKNDKSTPYSFISTLADSSLLIDEIAISEWLADDLNAKKGDTISLNYFDVGLLRTLYQQDINLKVKIFLPQTAKYTDSSLMPQIPGLSNAGSCSKWETGFPIELVKIRDKDEQYWNNFRGTPKAFISLKLAEKLWSNRFGSYTALRLPYLSANPQEIQNDLSKIANPQVLGINVIEVKQLGEYAATNGTDFSQLFIGLSFFILVAGILLTAMLFVLSALNRKVQTGTLAALGLSNKQISKLYLTEASIVATIGASVGVILAIAYNQIIFNALNHIWSDIVRTDVLEVVIKPKTLIYGGFAGVEISVITIWIMIYVLLKKNTRELQKQQYSTKKNKRLTLFKGIVLYSSVLLGVIIIIQNLIEDHHLNPSTFFEAGLLWMISFFLCIDKYFFQKVKFENKSFDLKSLATQNRFRNRNRSLSIIALLTIGTFLVVSTGVNRKNLSLNANNKESGTGGFMFVGQSVIPIVRDINSEDYKTEMSISTPFSAVAFREVTGDDASCLNLNRISNPQILGVDPQLLNERFSFSTLLNESDKPWLELTRKHNGLIPAIADQTVIQWGLGKKVGDTLTYKNSKGNDIKVLLIGGLEASIFQGNIIIDSKFLLNHFPEVTGNKFFLFDVDTANAQSLKEELSFAFRDFGWQTTRTSERLAEFKSVENTYLTMFLMLGGLGLIIGSIGISIVIARNMRERKKELALLLSVGYSRNEIIKLIFRENLSLLMVGVFSGVTLALFSTLPSFVYNASQLPIMFLILMIITIVANGIVWIILSTVWNTSNIYPARELRND